MGQGSTVAKKFAKIQLRKCQSRIFVQQSETLPILTKQRLNRQKGCWPFWPCWLERPLNTAQQSLIGVFHLDFFKFIQQNQDILLVFCFERCQPMQMNEKLVEISQKQRQCRIIVSKNFKTMTRLELRCYGTTFRPKGNTKNVYETHYIPTHSIMAMLHLKLLSCVDFKVCKNVHTFQDGCSKPLCHYCNSVLLGLSWLCLEIAKLKEIKDQKEQVLFVSNCSSEQVRQQRLRESLLTSQGLP